MEGAAGGVSRRHDGRGSPCFFEQFCAWLRQRRLARSLSDDGVSRDVQEIHRLGDVAYGPSGRVSRA